MLSGSRVGVLVVTLLWCVSCEALGTRRGSGGGRGLPKGHHRDLRLKDLARTQRGLPGSAHGGVNSFGGFDKNGKKGKSWLGKNELAIELEEESASGVLDNSISSSDEYDYIDTPQVFSRERMQPEEMKLMQLASANARRVMEKGKCATPTERCVPVTGEPGKKYWPKCAILHQCDDTTGCCTSDSHTCQSRDSEEIELYFYVFEDSEMSGNRGGVQRLTFRNDTSCECRTKPKVKEPICKNLTPSCKCPKHFESVVRDGKCVCDCVPESSTYKSCRRYKKGKKFFTQSCLRDGKCSEPTCEYGSYLPSNKRCMRKSEKGKRKIKKYK